MPLMQLRALGRAPSRVGLIAAAATFATFAAAGHARANLRAKLKSGEIVTTSVGDSGVVPVRAMAVVEAPAERVFHVLTDIADYPDFLPRIRASRRVKDNVYELLAKLPWPVSEARVKLRFRMGRRGQTFVMTWKMAEGTLERYEGSAWVQPWGKERCLLTYEMLAVPRIPAPSALMNRGLHNAVRTVVKAIRGRASQELARASSPPRTKGTVKSDGGTHPSGNRCLPAPRRASRPVARGVRALARGHSVHHRLLRDGARRHAVSAG